MLKEIMIVAIGIIIGELLLDIIRILIDKVKEQLLKNNCFFC